MIEDDNDGQMTFGDLGGLKLPDICLTGEENPEKTSPRKLVPTGDRTWARCVKGVHAAAWHTAVDSSGNTSKFLRLDMTKDLNISKSAEEFSYWS